MSVQRIPYRETWLHIFRDGFISELADHLRTDPNDCSEYAEWAFRGFRNRIRRACDLRKMRTIIAAGINAETDILAISRRIRRDCTSQNGVDLVCDYNHVIAHREAYGKLQREAPNLIPLYAALVEDEDFPDGGEPTQCLRTFLLQNDFSPRLWRMLARTKGRLLPPFLDFYCGTAISAVFDLLRLLDMLRFHREPPSWLLWDLLALYGDPGTPQRGYADRASALRVPLVRIVALLERASAGEREQIHADFAAVLNWLSDTKGTYAETTMSKAPWSWFVRHAHTWAAGERVRLRQADLCWPVPFRSLHIENCEIVALANGYDLWQESQAMRHCADTFAPECMAGSTLIFSIRRSGWKRPLCSVRFSREEPGWAFRQVSGFANHLPPPFAHPAIRGLRAVLSENKAATNSLAAKISV